MCAYTWLGAPCRQAVVLARVCVSSQHTVLCVFQLLSRVNIDYIWHRMSRNRQLMHKSTRDRACWAKTTSLYCESALINVPLHQQLFPMKEQEY